MSSDRQEFDEKKPAKIPAYVEGLWCAWAEWIRQQMGDGDLDHLRSNAPAVPIRGTSDRKPCGPVLAMAIAIDEMDHSEAALVHAVYRQLAFSERYVVAYHYVGDRPLYQIPGLHKDAAYKAHRHASKRLRAWVLGLQLRKGDDESAAAAVERGRERRLLYGVGA